MFCLCIFSSTFSIDGRSRSSRGLRWRSWAALGAYVGSLGPLLGPMLAVLGPLGTHVGGLGPLVGLMLAVLGRSWVLCWRSWVALGAYVAEKCEEHGYLENRLISLAGARSAASGSVLSRSWGLCARSWVALGAYAGGLGPYVDGLGPLLGPMLAVLGRFWCLSWRSWPLLGPPKAV